MIIDQGVHVIVGNDPYTSAFPAIAAVRAANGLNFSRLNEATPLPPLPAITSIRASSINFIESSDQYEKALPSAEPLVSEKARMNQACKQFLCSGCWNNHCKMFVGFALANEFDRTVYQSKQGVVFAHADVFAGMDSGAALTHDDAASVNGLFHRNFTPSRSIPVTTIAGGTAAFLCAILKLQYKFFMT